MQYEKVDILIKLYLLQSFSLTIQWKKQTSCCENDYKNTATVGLLVMNAFASTLKLPEKA